jgi:hypothetical protein
VHGFGATAGQETPQEAALNIAGVGAGEYVVGPAVGWGLDQASNAATWVLRAGQNAANSVADTVASRLPIPGDADFIGPVPARSGVQPYEVDTFENLKARELPNDGLQIDHQPSNASNLLAREQELGRQLTSEEIEEVTKQGTAVAVPDSVHAAGPTFLWRNTPVLIAQDAADGISATIRDSEAMVQNTENMFSSWADEARTAADEIIYRITNGFGR